MKRICPICKREFETTSFVRMYCSPECARKMAVQKNYTNILKRNKIRVQINKDLLWVYGFKCAICGWNIPFFTKSDNKEHLQRGCEFHHIIPVSEGGTSDESNTILLCPNCHKMAHAGLLSRDELKEHTFTKEQIEKVREQILFEIRCKEADALDELF